ncbi:hypothetical protein KI387_033333, partial [Taxus chinensis]
AVSPLTNNHQSQLQRKKRKNEKTSIRHRQNEKTTEKARKRENEKTTVKKKERKKCVPVGSDCSLYNAVGNMNTSSNALRSHPSRKTRTGCKRTHEQTPFATTEKNTRKRATEYKALINRENYRENEKTREKKKEKNAYLIGPIVHCTRH